MYVCTMYVHKYQHTNMNYLYIDCHLSHDP